MPVTVPCPIIERPVTRSARTVGWFQSIPPRPFPEDPYAELGMRWEAETCAQPSPYPSTDCLTQLPEEGRPEKQSSGGPYLEGRTCAHLMLYLGVDCKTVGNLAHSNYTDEAIFALVERRLRQSAAYTLGQAISTGLAWDWVPLLDADGNPVLDATGCPVLNCEPVWPLLDKDGETIAPFCAPNPTLVCDGEPLGIRGLISGLENRLADCTSGEGVIYLPAAAAAFAVGGNGPVFKTADGRFQTALETEVVFGWGFHGWGPDGVPPEDPSCVWGYLGSRLIPWRSGQVDVADGDVVSRVTRRINNREFFVEEDYAVGWSDPCCVIAGQAKLCDPPGGAI